MSRAMFGGVVWLCFEVLFYEREKQLRDIAEDAGVAEFASEEWNRFLESWRAGARAYLDKCLVALAGEAEAKDIRTRIGAAQKDAFARRVSAKAAAGKKSRKAAQAGEASKGKQPRAKAAKAKKPPTKIAKRAKRKPKT